MKVFSALLLAAGAAVSFPAMAEDAEGCKDHPLFTRMPAYDIGACESKEFDAFDFPVARSENCDDHRKEHVEGAKSRIRYNVKEGATAASEIQIQRNFDSAVRKAGGSVVAETGSWDDGKAVCIEGNQAQLTSVFKLSKGGKEVWSAIAPGDGGNEYTVFIVEREAMKQDVVANELLDKINKDGFVALYINFDTGKATIKPDSARTIDDVVAMLKSAPDLKLEIGGHTDNVGGADANQKLSEDRARAVMTAIVQKGIPGGRLTSKGYGQSAPVADNRSEDGRAKNRRVELKKR